MKNINVAKLRIPFLLLTACALASVAASKNKLDSRVRDLTDYFEKVQQDSSKAVPAEILSKAEGLVIMRNYKAGFIVGIEGGHGVAIAKNKATGTWGPISFMKAGEGSFGFQAGGQRSDMVLVLMNAEGMSILTNPNMKVGVDVRATVGPKSAGDQANLKTDNAPVLVYGDAKGLYGGASLQTGGIFPDSGDNEEYYDQKLSPSEILTGGKVQPTPAAKQLADKIQQYAGRSAVGAPATGTTGKETTDKPATPEKSEKQ